MFAYHCISYVCISLHTPFVSITLHISRLCISLHTSCVYSTYHHTFCVDISLHISCECISLHTTCVSYYCKPSICISVHTSCDAHHCIPPVIACQCQCHVFAYSCKPYMFAYHCIPLVEPATAYLMCLHITACLWFCISLQTNCVVLHITAYQLCCVVYHCIPAVLCCILLHTSCVVLYITAYQLCCVVYHCIPAVLCCISMPTSSIDMFTCLCRICLNDVKYTEIHALRLFLPCIYAWCLHDFKHDNGPHFVKSDPCGGGGARERLWDLISEGPFRAVNCWFKKLGEFKSYFRLL